MYIYSEYVIHVCIQTNQFKQQVTENIYCKEPIKQGAMEELYGWSNFMWNVNEQTFEWKLWQNYTELLPCDQKVTKSKYGSNLLQNESIIGRSQATLPINAQIPKKAREIMTLTRDFLLPWKQMIVQQQQQQQQTHWNPT